MKPTLRPPIVARPDAGLRAVLGPTAPLTYEGGELPSEDVAGHVRAASAIRRWGERLVIMQDDVHVLALRDERGTSRPILLPAGVEGRRRFEDGLGNKQHKLDLEAGVVLPDGRLLALGSGSSPARESWVLLSEDGPRMLAASMFYAGLREVAAFAGSELNVEGALVVGDELWLFQRGNGAPGGGRDPVDAIGAVPLAAVLSWLAGQGPAPRLTSVTPVSLGAVDGIRFGFTDAARMADGRVAILACAEASADAITDGPVLGCRFGVLEHGALRLTPVVEEGGHPTGLKLEGLERCPGTEAVFDVVADMDRPDEPARFGRLVVTGS